MDFVGFLSVVIYAVSLYTQCSRCTICSAWLLDIRIPTCFEGYKFCLKESSRKQFSRIYISFQSAIHAMKGFLIIFGEANFVEVQKSTKSVKFVAHEKKVPYGSNVIGNMKSKIIGYIKIVRHF